MFKKLRFLAAPAALSLVLAVSPLAIAKDDDSATTFNMVVSAGAKACLPNASATVKITPAGPVEIMDVVVQGHSHVEGVTRFGATLVVNPGSATLPRNLVGVPGTVAILEIGNGGEVSAEIISLG